jgi:hypothetical protein
MPILHQEAGAYLYVILFCNENNSLGARLDFTVKRLLSVDVSAGSGLFVSPLAGSHQPDVSEHNRLNRTLDARNDTAVAQSMANSTVEVSESLDMFDQAREIERNNQQA